MASLALRHVYKVYPNGVKAVNDFNMEINDEEFIVFVGPSGCGKSTTLRMIAGLEEISAGELYIDNRFVNYTEPKNRDIAMVFQNYALYPHLNVYENIAFGLRLRHLPKAEIDEKVHKAAEMLGLTDYLKTKPGALSGGQRQRVALGRALVREPKVFLLDEPLSNLDAKLRGFMRGEITKLFSVPKSIVSSRLIAFIFDFSAYISHLYFSIPLDVSSPFIHSTLFSFCNILNSELYVIEADKYKCSGNSKYS